MYRHMCYRYFVNLPYTSRYMESIKSIRNTLRIPLTLYDLLPQMPLVIPFHLRRQQFSD